MKKLFVLTLVLSFLLVACHVPAEPTSPVTQPEESGPTITDPEMDITASDVVFEPYPIPIANPDKKIYDTIGGTETGTFGEIGYHTIVAQEEDENGYIWGKLEGDMGWTLVYQEILPELNMYFSIGVGAWANKLNIHGNGYFSGLYHDTDMGDTGDEYPNGTMYTCAYTGGFYVTDMEEYQIHLRLSDLQYKNEGTQWYQDGIRYIASEPYGLEDSGSFILYTPGTPRDSLPEEIFNWIHGAADTGVLDTYVLYNPVSGNAFVGIRE